MRVAQKEGRRSRKKTLKKVKKVLKKVLTKRSDCDIITKLSRKRGSERSLKIEQRREKYKHKSMCKNGTRKFLREQIQLKQK